MNKILISLNDVTIRYADLSSFSHINLNINRGEHMALAGNDEALKNALMDALAGNVPVIHGSRQLTFYNEYVSASTGTHLTPQQLIASVSTRHSFKNLSNTNDFYYQQRFNSSDSENSLTVQQYLEQIAETCHDDYNTLTNIIAQLKLQHLLSEGVIKLSNGETRRVLIAAALLKRPVVLLLFNPLAGLDVDSRKEIVELIDQVAASGVTIVLTALHGEMPLCISKVAVINHGQPITVISKEDYRPAKITACASVNEAGLLSLANNQKMPDYHSIVQMRNVNIAYDDKKILDNINWTVLQGERWALQGPNGAGKSTLLSLINGDNPQAFANDIVLFDRKKGSGESIWEIKQKIGFFSPELYQYFPGDTSGLQAVESGFYDTIGLFRPGNQAKQVIARQWMAVLGVEGQANKLLRNMAAVDQRLCLLARAMVKAPVLLILDEPCQGFNEQQKESFKKIVDTICTHSNATLIYVSHYQHEIPECVTQYFKLNGGRQVTHS